MSHALTSAACPCRCLSVSLRRCVSVSLCVSVCLCVSLCVSVCVIRTRPFGCQDVTTHLDVTFLEASAIRQIGR